MSFIKLVAIASPKFKLRNVLIIPFVLQIVTAVGIVGYISFRNGQEAVNQLSRQLRIEVAARTARVMEDYFKIPHEITRSNLNALRLNQIKLEDKPAIEQHFFYQLQTIPLVREVYVATPDGSITYVAHKSDGGFIANTTSNFPKRELYELDNQGRRGKLLKVTSYDARTRPWFKLIKDKPGQIWTQFYVFTTLQILGTSALEPYFDEQGNLVAIFSAQFPLPAIADFLKTIKVSTTGQVFLIDRSGSLLATSTGENCTVEVNGEKQLLKAVNSRNLLTSRTGQFLQPYLANLSEPQPQETSIQELTFDIDGNHQDVLIRRYVDTRGLDFLVVVVVPEADFMEQINANTYNTVILCLAALIVAIAIGIFTARTIANPIIKLTNASGEIATGNLNDRIDISDAIAIDEIKTLEQSFNKMAGQLEEAFDTLEDKVKDRTVELQTAKDEVEAALKELQLTQARLIQSEKMSSLGQLVSGVAHEINNPVSFIYGNLDYANRYIQELLKLIQAYQEHYPHPPAEILAQSEAVDLDFLVEDLPKVFDSMYEGAKRIREIVLALRTFSRLDQAEIKAVNLHDDLDSTLVILGNRLKSAEQSLEIAIQRNYGSLPLVECYSGQLNQVFLNILSNAIDALNAAIAKGKNFTPTITITTAVLSETWVEIRLADNGCGIPDHIKPHIFDPFFTTKPVGSGTGLGLAISYQIITETHGGSLVCNSQLGENTEFVIQIPLRPKSQRQISL